MELLYIFIQKFASLENQGVSLTSKFHIDYDFKKEKLTIVDSENSLVKYFHSNILDIKAIIGANGSGKSSIIKYLFDECYITTAYLHGEYPSNFFVFLNDDNEIIIHRNQLNSISNLEIINRTRKNITINHNSYYNEAFNWKNLPSFKNYGIIYFSNLFDNNQREHEFHDSFNISTNFLLKKSKEAFYNKPYQTGFEQTDCFRINELIRQLNFVNRNAETILDFKLPDYLMVSYIEIDQNQLIEYTKNSKKESEEANYHKAILSLIEGFNKFTEISRKVNNQKKHFLFLIQKSALLNYARFINEQIKISLEGLVALKSDVFNVIKNNISVNIMNFDLIIENIESIEKAYSNKTDINLDKVFSKHLFIINNFIKLSDQLVETSSIIVSPLNVPVNVPILKDWFISYMECKQFTDFLNFGWRDLSSGELARFNILSRFYEVLNTQRAQDKKGFIVLIDEGDIFLHPNWQRKFIDILNNDLAPLFGKKKIQIILTSHSPFVTSDLTKSHIHFFTPKELNDIGHKETFAQNIYSLFNDSFYLESPIGKFATDFIQDILDRLNGKKDIGDKKELKAKIDRIGDAFIKQKVTSMFYEICPEEYESEKIKRDRINQLEAELKRLKS